jgi:hypothetical protein
MISWQGHVLELFHKQNCGALDVFFEIAADRDSRSRSIARNCSMLRSQHIRRAPLLMRQQEAIISNR